MPYKNKEDQLIYRREYYKKNGSLLKNKINTWRRKQWNLLREYKKKLFCIDCGFSGKDYPGVLDFDHVRGVKISNINIMKATASFEKVMKEIKKCEVVCANCHRIRTIKRYEETEYPTIKYWKNKKRILNK